MLPFDATRRHFSTVFLALAALLFLAPCSGDRSSVGPGGEVAGTGVLQFRGIEGGCWELEADGREFEVLNLEEDFPSFAEDGLRVRFEGRVRGDVATVCQLGTNLELTDVERAE